MTKVSKKHEGNNTNVLVPVIVENLNDAELLLIAGECQKEYWEENSIVRTLSKQYFGGDSLTQMMFVANKILPIVAERLKCCSSQRSELLLRTYKEGFDAATECLIGANKVVQERNLQL